MEHLERRVAEATRSIRNKYNAIKRGFMDDREAIEKQLEPIRKPLKTLIDLTQDGALEIKKSKSLFVPKKDPFETPSSAKPSRKLQATKSTIVEFPDDDDDDDEIDDDKAPDMHQTPHEILSASFAKNPRLSEIMTTTMRENLGPLTREYMFDLINDTSGDFDTTYGIYYDDKWKMGNKVVKGSKEDFLQIGDKTFKGTRGLFELIFKSKPDKSKITKADVISYGSILDYTSAARRRYEASGRVKSNKGLKYKNFIKPIFEGKEVKLGGGFVKLSEKEPLYSYWDDPNELVSRLELLIASREAGNDAHGGEIASIEEELREIGCIS